MKPHTLVSLCLSMSLFLTATLCPLTASNAYASENREARAHCYLGDSQIKQKRYEQAERAFRDALKSDKNAPCAHHGLGQALLGLKRYEEAEKSLRQAISLAPREALYYETLGYLQYKTERFEESLDTYSKAVAYGGGPRAHAGYGQVLIDKEEGSKAETILRKSILQNPYGVEPYLVLGQYYRQEQRLDDADELYKYALRHGLNVPEIRKGLGLIFLDRNEYDLAFWEFHQAQTMNPNDPEAAMLLGKLYEKQKKYVDAARYYMEAVAKTAPEDRAMSYLKLGRSLAGNKENSLALQFFQKGSELKPQWPEPLLEIAYIYGKQKAWSDAEKALQKALTLVPQNSAQLEELTKAGLEVSDEAFYKYALALLYFDQKRYDEAIEPLEQAIARKPQNAEFLTALGHVYYEKRHTYRAEEYYLKALQAKSNYKSALLGLAQVQRDEGRYEEARDTFWRVHQLDSNSVDGLVGLGDVNFLQNRMSEARRYYDLAMVQNQSDPRAHMGLGFILQKQGEATQAEQKFKYAKRLDPDVVSLLDRVKLPQAHMALRPAEGPAPLAVTLDGRSSTDSAKEKDGLTSYAWYVDGQKIGDGSQVRYTFEQPGIYELSLIVEEASGAKSKATQKVTVGSGIALTYQGQAVKIDPAYGQMRLEQNRVLVPMRFIFELLGAELSWDEQSRQATAVKESRVVQLAVGSTTVSVNGESRQIDVPAQIDAQSGRLLIPLRFVAEGLGAKVNYDATSGTVHIE
ncbi:tetratricopeptide repeat protein [Heliorestis acidaminivorans]|nr:tetratricopeptide repeat protein [Heliorestis acidaminivorans]